MTYGKATRTHSPEKFLGPEMEYKLHSGNDCRWKISSTSQSDKVDLQKSEVSESDNTEIKGEPCHLLARGLWLNYFSEL